MDENLIKILTPLYKDDSRRIVREIQKYVQTQIKRVELPKPDLGWYKNIDLYSAYADGIKIYPRKTPFENLKLYLDNIQQLGCNGLHILPFLDSKCVDSGFDVRNYYITRKELGTLAQLQEIVKRASELNIRVFMDLVFNHVSDEHDWFKRAQAGDEKYREYFLYQKEKPEFIKTFEAKSAVWAEYKVNGKKLAVNIALPEQNSEIPHFVEGKDGYWYYHTYYPEELDLNWFNLDVFIEMAKILIFWTSRGFNFRMDAIPFIGKGLYKNASEANPNTHTILAALRCIAVDINPECIFLVESYEDLPSIIRYFGTTNDVEANLAYNFYLNTSIWVSYVKQDVKYIWDKLQKIEQTPKHAAWLNFLRNHDELSLAYLSPQLLKDVHDKLLKNGQMFRSKYGVAGRTYSFVEHDKKQFLMMYFLLMSLPGGVMIPYGDELAKKNETKLALTTALQDDARNLNRGVITKKEFNSPKAQVVLRTMTDFFARRQELRSYLNVWPEKISEDPAVLAMVYRLGTSELRIYINLSPKTKKITIKDNGQSSIAEVNRVSYKKNKITLGPYGGIWLQK